MAILWLLTVFGGRLVAQENIAVWKFPTGDYSVTCVSDLISESDCDISYVGSVNNGTNSSNTLLCSDTDNTRSLQITGLDGGSITFKISTLPFNGISVSYDLRCHPNMTDHGYPNYNWSYSLDGTNFTDAPAETAVTDFTATTFTQQTADFSSITALNGKSEVYFRLTMSGATSANVASNLDNVVFLGTAMTCLTPVGLTAVADDAPTEALISWNPGGANEESYTLIYYTGNLSETNLNSMVANNSTYMRANVTSPYTLTGLTANTTYYIYVRANCGDGDNSLWANTTVHTPAVCAISGLAASSIMGSTASLSWTTEAANTMVRVFSAAKDNPWETTDGLFLEETVNGTSYDLAGLSFSTTYYVYAKSVCSANNISETVSTSFTTSFADGVITVGTATGTSSYLPTNSYYNYSLTEQIYTAAEIGTTGSIESVSFYNSGSTYTRSISLYMLSTDKETFTSATDWVAVSSSNLVFSGSVTFTSGTWTTIVLTNSFEYLGGDNNLLIAFDDNTGDYDGSMNINTFSATNQSLYIYSDYTDYNPESPTFSGTRPASKNQIMLAIEPFSSCPKPVGLVASNINVASATITWLAGGDETAWTLKYGVSGFDVENDGTEIAGLTTPSYALSGLNAATSYDVYVKAVCGENNESSWKQMTFNTSICAPEDMCEIHYSLTDSYGDGWNGNAINVIDVATSEVLATLTMSNGSSLTGSLAICDGRAIRFEYVTGSYSYETSYEITDVSGTTIFSGEDALDEPVLYTMDCPDCMPVSNITIAGLTTTSASVSWTSGNSSWQYQLNDGEITTVDARTIDLTGLTANTQYTITIRAICGVDEYSDWATATFRTECDVFVVDAEHPFTEDFTSVTAPDLPYCWSYNDANSDGDYWKSYYNAVRLYTDGNSGNNDDYLILPAFELNGSYVLNYDVMAYSSGEPNDYRVVLSTTGFAPEDFTVVLKDLETVDYTTYQTKEVEINDYNGTVYIAMHVPQGGLDGWYLYFDNFVLRQKSSAAEITAFSFAEEAELADIDREHATVTCLVSHSTESLTGLVPTIEISENATIAPESGVAQDFTGPVTYTVTAEDGTTTKEWTVNVSKVATASSAKDILSFSFSGQLGESVIDATEHTVLAYAAWNYDFTNNITPTITVSPLATITPESGEAQNFANPVTYRVVAEDESYQDWVVTIVNDPNACVNPLPATFVVSDLTSSTATVAWERRYIETSYNVKVSTTAISVSDIATTDGDFYNGVVNDTVIALTGLAENTLYYVYVQSACGIETWVSKSFRTIVTPATIPYIYAFEDATENDKWVRENGTQTNQWYIGTASSNGGNGLYISNDGGQSNAYTISSSYASYVYAYRTIDMTVGDYVVSYDWKGTGESSYDYMRVFFVPSATVLTAGSANGINTTNVPNGWIALDGASKLNLQSSWQSKTVTVGVNAAGTYNLVFYWRNDTGGGSNPPASVDNISVTKITCPVVADIETDNITTTSADITWTERGTATAWDVVFSATALTDEQLAAATPEPVNAASYQATGLTQNTPYYIYVRAHCSDDDQSDWVASQFRTECGEQAIPYSQNFNDYTATSYSTAGVMPDCWDVNYSGTSNSYSPHVCNYTYYAPSSDNYLVMVAAHNETVGENSYAILPTVAGGYANRYIEFETRISSTTLGSLSLGYMDGDNFTVLRSVATTTTGTQFSYVVPNTVPVAAKLAFRFTGSSTSYAYLGIDNVLVRDTYTDNTILSYAATTEQGDAICAVDNDAHTISVVLRSGYVAGAAVSQVLTVNEEHATAKQQIGGYFVDVPATFSWYMTTADTTLSFKVIAENGDEQPYTATVTVESCAAPSALVAEQTSLTNVNCSWTPAEGTTAWNFYYSTTQMTTAALDALTASDYTTVNTASASATVVGETTYYWYVRADCGGSYSAWMESSFTTWENCVAPTNLTTTVINDNDIVVSWNVQDNLPLAEAFGIGTDSFERDVISEGSLTYTNGTYPWSIVSTGAHSGSNCLVSASGNHSTTSEITATVNYDEPFEFSFWYKVSSESGWDKFYFSIDNEDKVSGVSGTINWTRYTYTMPAGSHDLSWRYTKDASGYAGSDCVWIDDVTLPMYTMVSGGNSSVVLYKNDVELATVPATQTSYTDEGLEAGNYCYKVKTICREGSESEFSAPVCQDINACLAVTNMSATNVTATSATISWTRGDEVAWNMTVNGGSPIALTETDVTVDANVITYALAGLEPMTDYTVTIQSDCGGSVSQSVASVDFTTDRVPATLPYTCDFENAVENNGWVRENGAYTNKWCIGTATNNGGTKALYVSNDNGTTNAYGASASYVYAYREIDFASAGEYVVSFDWKARGETGCWDAMYAALVPSGIACPPASNITSSTNSLPTGYINVADVSQSYNTTGVFLWTNTESGWITSTMTIDIQTSGVYTLVFYWKNDGSGGSNPPAAVDNINIHALTCPTVGDLAAAPANITSNSAVITWTERGTAEAWEVIVSASEITNFASATAVPVTEETYPATGLNAETTYHVYVRANCGTDENSQWAHATFTTVASCPVPDGLATSELSGSSATITWNGYTASNWTLEYRLGTTGDWTVVAGLDAATYTITGLDGQTTYNVRVKAVCDDDAVSAYSSILSFATTCAAITELPWEDSFENGIDCWTLVDADGDGYQWQNASAAFSPYEGSSAMASASYDNNVGALTPENWLISPAIDLTSQSGTIKLSYYVKGQDVTDFHERYKVAVSTTNTEIASFATEFEETLNSNVWDVRTVDLSQYAGQTIYIAFVHYECTDQYWLVLDDVKVFIDNSTDAAVTAVSGPSHGDYSTCALTNAEEITVTILNNGGSAISDFEVSYTINDGTPVTETVTTPIDPAQTYDYTFVQTADLSEVGEYTITANVYLTGDENADNNNASMSITTGDAIIRIHALTDNGGGQSWVVTNTLTDEVVAERTSRWEWNVEINDYACVDASQCYSIVVSDESGGMTGDTYVEILYNGEQVAGSTEPGSFNDYTLVAERFTPECDVFTINASVNGDFGSIEPSGVVVVSNGDSQIFNMIPWDGFALSSLLVDGVEQLSQVVNNTYTFENVSDNHTIVATFDVAHTITATAGANGSISPEGQVSVGNGGSQTFTVTANEGYIISSVLIDETNEQITSGSVLTTFTYQFTNVTENRRIDALFGQAEDHTITATAGNGGSISPNGDVSVPYNGTQAFTITPDEGYSIESVILEQGTPNEVNVTAQLVDNVYTFTNVVAAHTINAYFSANSYNLTIHYVYAATGETAAPDHTEAVAYGTEYSVESPVITNYVADQLVVTGTMPANDYEVTVSYTFNGQTFTITATAGEGGTITPAEATVEEGGSADFTIVADEHYRIASVIVDPNDANEDVTAYLVNGVYTFTNVTADHVIVANFEQIPNYIITATAGNGGTITPAEATVEEGGSAEFTITAENGYSIESVIVDPETANENVTDQLVNGVYTFTNVVADHTINASFAANSYNLTIHYVYADNTTAGADYTAQVAYGAEYSVESPAIAGYTATPQVVSGTMPAEDVEVTVTYNVNNYNLTIHYVYADNTTAADDHTETLAFGAEYSVESPAITGYTADQTTVSGTMPAQDVEVTVTYGVNSYNLTIHYVYADNTQAFADSVITVVYDTEYSVESPALVGYTAEPLVVAGTMPANDVEATVTYTINTYTITATAGDNGNITPSGTVEVTYGSSQSFTITPDTDYRVLSLLVDNNEAINDLVDGVYTFTNVIADHTIAVTFVHESANSYTITASAGANGTITPSGTIEVIEHEDKAFTITPDEGYSIASVLVDNAEAITALVDNVYTFTDVTADHTIEAAFSVNSYNLTIHYVNAANNATLEDDYTAQVAYGAAYSVESPVIAGYTTEQLVVEGTMPAHDVEVTVTYNVNSYTLTIHYVYADQTEARPDYTSQVVYGAEYSVESPAIIGYTADQTTVAGTMPAEDVIVNVIYNVNSYNLTIHYVYADNTTAFTDSVITVVYNTEYSVESPALAGYTADPLVVAGTMPANDVEATVTYTANNYTLTIHYVNAADNAPLADDYTAQVAYNATYSVESPVIAGYTTEQLVVSGIMPAQDVEVTVTYNVNSYNLTIHYVYADNTTAFTDSVITVVYNTEYSVESPALAGYTADPLVVAGTMPANDVEATVTYTANNYTLTIHYVNAADNAPLADDYTAQVAYNATYSVESPVIAGYTTEQLVVSGTMPAQDVEETVYYNVNNYNLTIHYVYADNTQAFADSVISVAYNTAYSVESPALAGYTATPQVVSGTMPAQDVEATVTYTANNYTLTIHYVNAADNAPLADDYTAQLAYGAAYSVESPVIAGYTTEQLVVEGTMPAQNVEVTVQYNVIAYIINATAGENGTITPSGEVSVNEGASQTFTITPDEGYRIESVIVDGVNVIDEIIDFMYTFYNVRENHTINVTFTDGSAVDEYAAGSMSVYPNPNNGMFSIDFSRIEGDVTYQLINANGAVVETRDINVMDGETMNFNYDLRPGAYFVRIISADKVYVEQIVVE